jgi:hypothetical protein
MPKNTKWKPGQSGNPAGKPKGILNAKTIALKERGDLILARAEQDALAGDIQAAQLWLRYNRPSPKPITPLPPINLTEATLPEVVKATTDALAEGLLNTEQLTSLVNLASLMQQGEQYQQLINDVTEIKNAMK